MRLNAFILVLFILIVGCNQTKNNWIKVKNENSVTAVKKFLKENPNSAFDSVAKILLDSLEWKNTQKVNSLESYKYYLSNYPNSKYKNNVLRNIDSLEWFFALNSGDSSVMLKYLTRIGIHKVNSLCILSNGSEFPNGHYTGCVRIPGGGLTYFGGGPVEIFIVKDLVRWTKEEIERKSLKAGVAWIYLNDSIIATKPIDLKMTEKEYCKVFGVPYLKIYSRD